VKTKNEKEHNTFVHIDVKLSMRLRVNINVRPILFLSRLSKQKRILIKTHAILM